MSQAANLKACSWMQKLQPRLTKACHTVKTLAFCNARPAVTHGGKNFFRDEKNPRVTLPWNMVEKKDKEDYTTCVMQPM